MENNQISENENVYDKSEIYDNEIKQHVEEIQRICVKNDIPFLYSFAIKNTKKGTEYKNNVVTTANLDFELTDDRITKCLCAMNGWEVKIPGVEIDPANFTEIEQEEFDDSIEEIPEDLV